MRFGAPVRGGAAYLMALWALWALSACAADGGAADGGAGDASTGADALESTPDGASADAAPSPAIDASCHLGGELAGGACCPTGWFAAEGGSACAQVGPIGCSDPNLGGGACEPRWCRPTGACPPGDDVCAAAGRLCISAAEPSCPAGSWPDLAAGGACSPAGLVSAPGGVPRWCDGAVPGPCTGDATGCEAGQAPRDGACADAGPAWACPPGFREQPGHDTLPDCEPDPDDCLPWEELAGAIHVDAAYTGTGTGSFDKPFSTIGQAVGSAPSGATVVIAPGTYAEALVLDGPITLRGRCAAQVTLEGPSGEPAVHVPPDAAPGTVRFQRVRVTQAPDASAESRGVVVEGPVAFEAERVFLDAPVRYGILVHGAGASASLLDCLVARVGGPSPSSLHAAVDAQGGAHVHIERSRITRCRHDGVSADGAGTTLELRDAIVDGSELGDPTVKYVGRGVAVTTGATGVVEDVRIADCVGVGLIVLDHATVKARGLAIERTRAADGHLLPALALQVLVAADVELAGVRLSDNEGLGLVAAGDVDLRAVGVLVERSAPPPTFEFAYGALVGDGARAELLATVLRENTVAGIQADGAATRVQCSDLLVERTRAHVSAPLLPGTGINVQRGARVTLQRARIQGSEGAGVSVLTSGRLSAEGLLVDGTTQLPAFPGHAVAVVGDASRVTLTGSRLEDNEGVGVLAGEGARARLLGVTIEDTAQVEGEGLGTGVMATTDSTVNMDASWVARSMVAGVAFNAGGSGTLTQTVVSATSGGQYTSHGQTTELGDGVVVDASADVDLRQSIVAGNVRAGLFVVSGGAPSVSGSAATGNLYGIVVDDQGLLEGFGNVVFGNALQDFIGDEGLTVPPPPVVAVPQLPSL